MLQGGVILKAHGLVKHGGHTYGGPGVSPGDLEVPVLMESFTQKTLSYPCVQPEEVKAVSCEE